jgi:glycosyltransferase involved in cell wall biosynthesis
MTSRKRLVSVVIPTKDRKDLLREALASVRALEGPDLEFEIIVVDNCSSEDMSGVAAEFGARFVSTREPGASATRNAGFEIASGEFVCFLDDDDTFLSGHVRPMLEFLDQNPEYAACVGQVQLADFELHPIGAPFPNSMPSDGDLFREFFRENPQVGSVVVRDWVKDKVGLFDVRLVSSEDYDWALRLARGNLVGFVPVPAVLFRQRPMATHDDLQWMRLGIDTRVIIKHFLTRGSRRVPVVLGIRTMLRCRGGFYAYFTKSALTHAQRHERRAMYRCFYRALRSSPAHAFHDLFRPSPFRRLLREIVRFRGASSAAATVDS